MTRKRREFHLYVQAATFTVAYAFRLARTIPALRHLVRRHNADGRPRIARTLSMQSLSAQSQCKLSHLLGLLNLVEELWGSGWRRSDHQNHLKITYRSDVYHEAVSIAWAFRDAISPRPRRHRQIPVRNFLRGHLFVVGQSWSTSERQDFGCQIRVTCNRDASR